MQSNRFLQVSAEPIWFSRKNPDSLETSTSSANTGTGKKAKKSPKKKVVVKTEPTTPISTPTPTPTVPAIAEAPSGIVALHPLKTDGIESSTTEERREVWFHESCVIWAPGVYLVPPRLLGLDEAIADSQQAVNEFYHRFLKVTDSPFKLALRTLQESGRSYFLPD
jgi:hypothetical protein